MLAIAKHLDIKSFIAGGTSMGAVTSIYASLAQPNLIDGLIINMPPACWSDRDHLRNRYKSLHNQILESGLNKVIEKLNRTKPPPHIEKFKKVQELDYSQLARQPKETVLAIIKSAEISDLPNPNQLNDIKCKSVISAWNSFAGHPVSTAKKIHENINGSNFSIIMNDSEIKRITNACINNLISL